MKRITLTEATSLKVLHASPLNCPAGPKQCSVVSGRRTLAFIPVLSPTLTELLPASPCLRRVSNTHEQRENICLFLHLYLLPHLSFSELKRLLKLSHDHKFPSEWFFGVFFAFLIALIWTVSFSRLSSLQTSYSAEVRFGCGAAGEGQSSLLAAG